MRIIATTVMALLAIAGSTVAASAQDAAPAGQAGAATTVPATGDGPPLPGLPPPGEWRHAMSLIGSPGYPAGFAHFNYVNPDAPKGGTMRMSAASQTFDTLNPIIDKGVVASGLGLIYQSLTMRALDEADISSEYGEIADGLRFPDDYSYVTYRLNPAAKWNDGEPITPDDVVWSFNKTVELNQSQRFYYQHVKTVAATAPDQVTFVFDQAGNRELPEIVGELLILPRHWWEGTDASGKQRDIAKSTLEPPLGSGPYRIADVQAGRSIAYERVPDFWAKDLNVNVGSDNFDRIVFSYYRDLNVEFEAFKADDFDYWWENEAKRWATAYDFPAIKDGKVKKQEVQLEQVSGVMVGFVPNLRRPFFQDARVRRALNYAFDFETLNQTIFFNQYGRINSFFYGLPLAASGLPQGKELEILDTVKDKVPPEVFTQDIQEPGRRRRAEGAREPVDRTETARRGGLRAAPADQRALAAVVRARRHRAGGGRLPRRRQAAHGAGGGRHRHRGRCLRRLRPVAEAADGDGDDPGQRQDRRARHHRAPAQRVDDRAGRPALPAIAGAHRHQAQYPSGGFQPIHHAPALTRFRHGLYRLGAKQFTRQRAAGLLGLRRRRQPGVAELCRHQGPGGGRADQPDHPGQGPRRAGGRRARRSTA